MKRETYFKALFRLARDFFFRAEILQRLRAAFFRVDLAMSNFVLNLRRLKIDVFQSGLTAFLIRRIQETTDDIKIET